MENSFYFVLNPLCIEGEDSFWIQTPARIWRTRLCTASARQEKSANITSPISRNGRTTTPLNAPSPVWKKIAHEHRQVIGRARHSVRAIVAKPAVLW
jgi:hypothetical protein